MCIYIYIYIYVQIYACLRRHAGMQAGSRPLLIVFSND